MSVTVQRPTAVHSLPRKTPTKQFSGLFVDPLSRTLYTQLLRIAASPLSALIEGETGTGKEVVARELHQRSPRSGQAFVAINCGAIPAELVESELFGHERGSFTGAAELNRGWFEAADGGTLFLDEVGELPLPAQVSLLRVLQEREITRVGSRRSIPVNVRVIAATNQPLQERVTSGRFRADLFYRLNVANLTIRPLRERRGDILPLAEFFLARHRSTHGQSVPLLSPEAQARLQGYHWPGNVRELENVIQYAVLMADGPLIRESDLVLASGTAPKSGMPIVGEAILGGDSRLPADPLTESIQTLSEGVRALISQGRGDLLSEMEELVVAEAFEHCGRNQVKTAELLGITRSVLRVRLKRYGLI